MKRSLIKHTGTFLQSAIAVKWSGVDESVIERYAKQAGYPASKPLFGIQGDLLLFLFLAAGLIAGFIIGYYWRALFKSGVPESKMQQVEYRVQEPEDETTAHILQTGVEVGESAESDGGAL